MKLREVRRDRIRTRNLARGGRDVQPVGRHRLVEEVELARNAAVQLFDGLSLGGTEPLDDRRSG